MKTYRRNVAMVLAAVVLLITAACGVASLAGMRAHVLTTPSMGTRLPVGSLAITVPSSIEDVQVGDIITVRDGKTTRTHEVVDKHGATATTQGVLNGAPDAQAATDATLVGKVVFSCPALGWGIRLLGCMAVGWLVLLIAASRIEDELHRRRYRNLGAFLGLACGIILLRPLLGAYLLGMEVNGVGEEAYARAHVVSTGLMPVHVVPVGQGGGENSAVMSPTGTDSFAIDSAPNEEGDFVFRPLPVLTWPWVLGLLALVLSPFAWFYIQYRRALREDRDAQE